MKPVKLKPHVFYLEITSFNDFIKFVNFIRGENLDETTIAKLTEGLNKDADILIEAEKNQGE